jgi:hypothetical protein
MHPLSFPARLKAEELLRRTGHEDIRIEKMLPQKHILFDSPPGQRNRNTPTEIPCSLAKAGYRLCSWRVHGLNCQSVWRTSVHERHTLAYKMEIKLAPCASRCPVTSALRNWRHDISRDAPLCNAAPPRFIFGTVSRKMRKERCRRKGFLTATATQKTHVDSAIKKSLLWLNDKAP